MFLFLDSRQAKIQGERIERQEKILSLQDAFERIMNATHVSDIEVKTKN